ncbi:AraC family transcriptional regulator [Kiritimatiellaeota bacterium B1221]|nr:AraC family transcriptional regulator [Kiritimatiellaeota bacterium B1221]
MIDLDELLTPPLQTQRFGDYFGGITSGRNINGYPKHDFIHVENHDANRRLPLHVLFAGRDISIPGVYRATHERNLLAIEFLVRGQAAFRQDGHSFIINENEIMIAQPLCETEWGTIPPGETEKVVVALSGSLLGEILTRLGLSNTHHMQLPRPAMILKKMEDICAALCAPERDSSAINAAAYELLISLSEEHEHADQPEALREAMAMIEERLHSSLKLEELVRQCGQSESSLRRIFNEHMGCSPIAYYLRRKIRFSQNLLCNANLSVKEISYNLGYRDPLYFSAQFKRATGMSPSEYREQHNSGLEEPTGPLKD